MKNLISMMVHICLGLLVTFLVLALYGLLNMLCIWCAQTLIGFFQ